MYSFSNLFLFDYRYTLLTILFIISNCIIAVEFSKKLKKQETKRAAFFFVSFILALNFWIGYILTCMSVDIPLSSNSNLFYSLFNLICGYLGSAVALKLAQIPIKRNRQYIFGSTLIGSTITVIGVLSFSISFSNHFEFKPVFFIMAVILIFSTSFSICKLLIQFMNEESFRILTKWKYIGCIAAGTALTGDSHLILVSVVKTHTENSFIFQQMFPFIFVIATNLVLLLVLDLVGDNILMKNVQSYTSLFRHNPAAVLSVDIDGYILDTNKAATVITGFTKKELKGKSVGTLFETPNIQDYLSNILKGTITNIETQILNKQGSFIEVRIRVARTFINNEIIGAFGIIEDVTEQKRAECQIQYLAYHDELTNLPNRRKVKTVMDDLAGKHSDFSILLLDFDKFKRINDTFGHSFGDRTLVEIGRRLRSLVPEHGVVARLGGDEFLIVFPAKDFHRIAEDIIAGFQQPLIVNGYEVLMTASMGIACFPSHTDNMDDLYKFADLAMYYAKENGANGFFIYNDKMTKETINKIELENDLKKAIEDNELMLYFQPKYNTKKNAITGSEVLLRWKHPVKGMIPPKIFIPMAEESGLIVTLEKFVIFEACKIIAGWKDRKRDVKRVSINISLITILQEGFVDYILHQLNKFNLDGSFLELEITERIVMKNENEVNSVLQELRQNGIKISIDDFGTGYSSLSYLYKLNVDVLKIDQSFIHNIQDNREIILAIISLAKSLNMKVIAEGTETKEQIEILNELGCEEVQGYYFSPPISQDLFEKKIDAEIPSIT